MQDTMSVRVHDMSVVTALMSMFVCWCLSAWLYFANMQR